MCPEEDGKSCEGSGATEEAGVVWPGGGLGDLATLYNHLKEVVMRWGSFLRSGKLQVKKMAREV